MHLVIFAALVIVARGRLVYVSLCHATTQGSSASWSPEHRVWVIDQVGPFNQFELRVINGAAPETTQ